MKSVFFIWFIIILRYALTYELVSRNPIKIYNKTVKVVVAEDDVLSSHKFVF